MLVDDRELTNRALRIDALLQEVESFPDSAMRDKATEIVETLLLLYGEGLARMLDALVGELDGESSDRVLRRFADDELVSHLLLLHDLHPVSVETRILRALEEVRPYLESHGGNVAMLGVEDGVARLRLQGSCSGCPSSTVTLKLAIEEAVRKAAPELVGIKAEGVTEPPPRPIGFLPTSDIVQLKGRRAEPVPAWMPVGDLPAGNPASLEVAGVPLLFLREGDRTYAYRDVCPQCGGTLHEGSLQGIELRCGSCGHRYDVRNAGRSLDGAGIHLQPVPLLARDGTVRVALGQV